jgi:hypothetical protein
MSQAPHTYSPPQAAAGESFPAPLARYLDGTDLLAKTQALRLSTVDAEGWPHASLLSAGDMVAVAPGRVRFVIFPQSGTAANLRRDGRLTLTLWLDGGMCELRMRARPLAVPGLPLAAFEASLLAARRHVAPYAAVTSGITFALHDPLTVLPRWDQQIAALRAAR